MGRVQKDDSDATSLNTVYDQVCQSYHAVDDLRMELLGLLPVATGPSVFVLLSGREDVLG